MPEKVNVVGQPATRDCYFCAGTGEVSAERADEINGSNGAALVRAGRCLCTVSWQEVEAVLPSMFDDILARAKKEAPGDER